MLHSKKEKTSLKSNIAFALTFDRDRAQIMHMMINSFSMIESIVDNELKKEGLSEPLNKLVEEFETKYHEQGWCPDPDCPWKPSEKKKNGHLV